MNFENKKGQGATEYLLMLAAVLVVVAAAVYYVTQAGGYPAIGAVPEVQNDNEIYLTVQTGSIAATNWKVTFDPNTNVTQVNLDTDGVGEVELASPEVQIAEVSQTSSAQTITVELSHVDSGHVYVSKDVTIPAQ